MIIPFAHGKLDVEEYLSTDVSWKSICGRCSPPNLWNLPVILRWGLQCAPQPGLGALEAAAVLNSSSCLSWSCDFGSS